MRRRRKKAPGGGTRGAAGARVKGAGVEECFTRPQKRISNGGVCESTHPRRTGRHLARVRLTPRRPAPRPRVWRPQINRRTRFPPASARKRRSKKFTTPRSLDIPGKPYAAAAAATHLSTFTYAPRKYSTTIKTSPSRRGGVTGKSSSPLKNPRSI